MKKKTTDQFIKEAKEIHGDNYDYSKSNYITNNKNLIIICREHGEFNKKPVHHINRVQGCPKCSKVKQTKNQSKSTQQFIKEAKEVHGDEYDYGIVDYSNTKIKVKIICKTHGVFEQTPDNHLSGRGCKYCGGTTKYETKRAINVLTEIYGDKYDYNNINYTNAATKIDVVCKEHGIFTSSFNNLTNKKRGCPYCQINRIFDTKSFITKAKEIHDGHYTYNNTIFNGIDENTIITCANHGDIEVTPNYHLRGGGCKECYIGTSKYENELKDFINSLDIKFDKNNRQIIKPFELDIYIPSKNIAIEFNGLYWHSEVYKSNEYHVNKTRLCEDNGIQLIHIFEDEWTNKKDIVKSRLKNILGLTTNKIYGRKCEIREVPTKDKTKFLNENHIQGAVGSKVNVGLYYEDELVSIMTFGKRPVFNDSEYELIRFCNKIDLTVVGGASKLFKNFIKVYSPKEIISYADRRWSIGNMYNKLGFNFIENTQPNWFIINNKKREHRVKYQKHKLVNMGYCKNKTAHQICLDNKLYRIYDCGTKKYIYG
tara:strand:- start:2611 stop:4230 length:1620 start_codon:yes stop_codon:yes gene_type:complete